MRTNQLPNNSDMAAMGQPVWSETSYDGIGFGLGFAVVLDPVKLPSSPHPGSTTGRRGKYFFCRSGGGFVRRFLYSTDAVIDLPYQTRAQDAGVSGYR